MVCRSHPPRSPGRAGEGTSTQAQGGQAIVLIALMLTVLMGMVAIAIDGSRAYAVRRDLQAAADAAALAAADKMQQTSSYVAAEQAATTTFGTNLRLYSSPSCSGYGTPGASPWTVSCTFSDGTVLTDVARTMGPQGSRFQISATRTLQLQFGRVLTNGTSPILGATANGAVNNLLYSPALAALNQSGCGRASGDAITINGSGTLRVNGDFVSNELKPPDEPSPSDNTARAANQFWDTDGVNCSGAAQVATVGGPRGIPIGNWAFELTSVRTDTYGGVSYTRESAPSTCY